MIMTTPAIIHNSFTVERTYPTTKARVFAAMADPKKKKRWFAEGEGFVIDSYTLDFKVGGFERTRFRFGNDGPPMTNDCLYLDIVEEERVVFAYAMTIGGAPMSSSLASIELLSAPKGGTLMRFTEHTAYVDGNDGGASRKEGTQQLFERLAQELDRHA
jgi:uncharacterized protein YndB with AHSA1/START domain